MKRLTKQECFNNAWKAFVVKRLPKSVTKNSYGGISCVYQHPVIPTHGCAIGVNLTQKQRNEVGDFLGTVRDLFYEFPVLKKRFPENSLRFLDALQGAHDRMYPDSFQTDIKAELKRLAKNCRLKIPK